MDRGDRQSFSTCAVAGTDADEVAAAAWLLPLLGGGTVGGIVRTPRAWSPEYLEGRGRVGLEVAGLLDSAFSPLTEHRNEAALTYDILWVTVKLADGSEPRASLVPLCNGWRALCVAGARLADVDWDCTGAERGGGCVSTDEEGRRASAVSWLVQFSDRGCAAAQFGTLDHPRDSAWDERYVSDRRVCTLLDSGLHELAMAREMGLLAH